MTEGRLDANQSKFLFFPFFLSLSLSLALTSAYQVLGVASVKEETCGLGGSVKVEGRTWELGTKVTQLTLLGMFTCD